jgi:hypothetical protein
MPLIRSQWSAFNVNSTTRQNLPIPLFSVEPNRSPELPSVPSDSVPGDPLPELLRTSHGQYGHAHWAGPPMQLGQQPHFRGFRLPHINHGVFTWSEPDFHYLIRADLEELPPSRPNHLLDDFLSPVANVRLRESLFSLSKEFRHRRLKEIRIFLHDMVPMRTKLFLMADRKMVMIWIQMRKIIVWQMMKFATCRIHRRKGPLFRSLSK